MYLVCRLLREKKEEIRDRSCGNKEGVGMNGSYEEERKRIGLGKTEDKERDINKEMT